MQAEIEKALKLLTGQEVKTTGAGRTDTGVHAREFFAHFDSEILFDSNSSKHFVYQMNGILPRDIVIHNLFLVNNDANARFDAISRTYQYYICPQKNPFYEGQVYYFFAEPDIELMNKGARIIAKQTDFSSFCQNRNNHKNKQLQDFRSPLGNQRRLAGFQD